MSLVIDKAFIEVDRRSNRLFLFRHNGDRYIQVESFTVSVGMAGHATPRGPHVVLAKALNPDWRKPDEEWVAEDQRGVLVPGGDPANPLKEAFISLGHNVEEGLGIHGTGDLANLGKRASHGCIRMAPKDIVSIYDRVPVGTVVFID